MAPGAGSLPPAAGLDVAGPVSEYLRSVSARQRRLVRLALVAFEWLPFPWRFSRAGPEAREDFLARMESSPSWWRQDLLLLLKILAGMGYGRHPRVRAALSYEPTCEVREPSGEVRRPPAAIEPSRSGDGTPIAANGEDGGGRDAAPLGDLAAPGEREECDVVIVGSGAGGAVAAAILAEAGLDVIVLEAGAYHDRRTYPDDPLEALATLYRDGGLTVAEGRPAIPFPLGRAVGGTTVINSGTCFRTPRRVLERWREEEGIAWAGDLDPHFDEIEEMLDVRAPELADLGRNGQLVAEGARAIGASGAPLARNAGGCVRCSSCPEGCRLDAKRAMHVSYLPRAVAAGARVRAGVEAQQVLLEDGRAVGVRCLAGEPGADSGRRAMRPYEVRARAVVAAGGAVGTPELLLRSGVRDPAGALGGNLHLHPAAWIGARFAEEVRGWEGIMQSYQVDEWTDRGLLMEATFTPLAFGAQWLPGTGREHHERVLAFDRVASNGVHLSDASAGRVALARDGSVRITYRLTQEDADRLLFGIARAAEIFFAAGAEEVYSQVRGLPVIDRDTLADFEAARPEPQDLRLEAFHPMGTARMGSDPATSATSPDGALRGTEGLYIADASLLPTSIGVNPMLTIMAVAGHVAAGLAEGLTGTGAVDAAAPHAKRPPRGRPLQGVSAGS